MKRRMYLGATASLFHPSQVFSDTQRVDLFTDPRWDTAGEPDRRSAERRSGLGWVRTAGRRLVLGRPGQHTRSDA